MITPTLPCRVIRGFRGSVRLVCTSLALTTILLVGLISAANAATLNVPGSFATIGAAVAAATSGDTILVDSSGSPYSGQNILTSKVLTIQSVSGAASTIINCGGNHFGTFQGSGTTITGFTFQNSSSSLGVIGCQTSVTISDCIFSNNDSGFNFSPACINTSGSSNTVTINNCTFSGNSGLGAIEVNSVLHVSNCTFSNNTGKFGSGAIYANTATGTFTNCTFSSNQSDTNDQGGAVYWVNGGVDFIDCNFSGNSSGAAGGAVEIGAQGLDAPATFTRCLFTSNSAPYGGAIGMNVSSSHTASVTATDCVFYLNSAATDEAAVGSHGNAVPISINLTNCSFASNFKTGSADAQAGTIGADNQTTLVVKNCILYGDTTGLEISGHSAGNINVNYSDINQAGFNGVNACIQADPLYFDSAHDDLHLPTNSPCAGTGTTSGAPAIDMNQYTFGTTTSMGAFSPISFVVSSPSPVAPGNTSTTAVTATAADGTTTITNYSGTVHFTSSDALATLPSNSTLTNGTGTFSTTFFTSGSQTVTATDSVEGAYTGTSSGVTVNTVSTTIAVSDVDNPIVYGASTNLTATVAQPGGLPVPTGTVQFKVDGTDIGSAATLNGSGVGTLSTSALPAGKHYITAAYSGDSTYASGLSPRWTEYAFDAVTLGLIPSMNPSYLGQSVSFTATVSNGVAGAGVPTGSVQFFSGGSAISGIIYLDGSGAATFTTSTLPTGTSTLYVRYSGDTKHHGKLFGPYHQVVSRAATSTALQSSLNPSTLGQPVTFTATVTSTVGTPTGAVQFKWNGVKMGAPRQLTNGVATYVTTGGGPSTVSITAEYQSSAVYVSSTSNTVTQVTN